MAENIVNLLTEAVKDQRSGFEKWLKNTGRDDKFTVTLFRIPLDGKSKSQGGSIDGNESKETSEGS